MCVYICMYVHLCIYVYHFNSLLHRVRPVHQVHCSCEDSQQKTLRQIHELYTGLWQQEFSQETTWGPHWTTARGTWDH